MSENKDFQFDNDIDKILAEFSSFSDNMLNGEQPAEKEVTPAVHNIPRTPAAETPEEDIFGFGLDFEAEDTVKQAAPAAPRVSRNPVRPANPQISARKTSEYASARNPNAGRNSASNLPPQSAHMRRPADVQQNPRPARHTAPEQAPAQNRKYGSRAQAAPGASVHRSHAAQVPDADATRRIPRRRPAVKSGHSAESDDMTVMRTAGSPRRNPHSGNYSERPSRRTAEEVRESTASRGVFGIIGTVCAVISIFVLCWVFVNIHPDSGTAVASSVLSQMNLVEKFDNYANNAASDALGDLAYIPKIYTIAEDVNVAPKPNPDNFGSTTDPAEVMKVIESASALLGDQKVAFNPDANFIPNSKIQYYLDDTILAISWKEDIDGKCCSCAEVKIAHGSQIRRKVAGDTYSVGKRYYATDMAKECNSVVAINGDFYDFRPIGITVFQRQLFRFEPGKLDSCHVTSNGDFLFSYAGELTDEESTRQFIKDNDVVFSLSFGPILIDHGEYRPVSGYPIGEVNTTYSRSAIGMLDNLHYMLMTVNYDVGYTVAATLNELGRFMESKGCTMAYGLDGGQTSVLMMNGELVNHVDYGNERTMSDIIYFATAIPEEEAAK